MAERDIFRPRYLEQVDGRGLADGRSALTIEEAFSSEILAYGRNISTCLQ